MYELLPGAGNGETSGEQITSQTQPGAAAGSPEGMTGDTDWEVFSDAVEDLSDADSGMSEPAADNMQHVGRKLV